MSVAVTKLSGVILPESVSVRRISTVPAGDQSDEFHAKFDATTLLYDCVYSDRSNGYLFTAPAFENLWSAFQTGLRVNGKPVRGMRRKRSGRSDQVFVRGPANADIAIEIEGQMLAVAPRLSIADNFTDQNLLLAMNKNNDLSWIEDWATYHARAHGATGALLFDNGSTNYDLEALAEVFAGVPGFEASAVISAPYPYGFKLRVAGKTVPFKNLQTSVINLARRDFASRARAVLSCDIDEMVLSPDGSSVFEAAVQSKLGGFKIPGNWVYPENIEAIPCPQHAHINRAEPDNSCHPKWCACPDGLLSRFGWSVHTFGGYFRRLAPLSSRFSLAHCSGTTTGWKESGRRFRWPDKTREDQKLVAALQVARPENISDITPKAHP